MPGGAAATADDDDDDDDNDDDACRSTASKSRYKPPTRTAGSEQAPIAAELPGLPTTEGEVDPPSPLMESLSQPKAWFSSMVEFPRLESER